jgi:hypothetical protein
MACSMLTNILTCDYGLHDNGVVNFAYAIRTISNWTD